MKDCSNLFVHVIVDSDAEFVYIANEIEDELEGSESGKKYYPDMLYRHSFKEVKLTGHEAAAAFRKAAESYELHNIAIFRAPESARDDIIQWAEEVAKTIEASQKELFDSGEELMINDTVQKLRLTRAMAEDFVSLVKKYKIKFGNIEFLRQYSNIQISTKSEVKSVYGSIREYVAKSIFPHLH